MSSAQDVDRALVSRMPRVIQNLQAAGVEEDAFLKAVLECREALAAEGWPTADLKISPSIQSDADAPLAIIDFFIDAQGDIEKVLDVESNVLTRVFSNPLIQELRLVVAVLASESEG